MLSRKTVFRSLLVGASTLMALSLTACDQRTSQERLASAQRQAAAPLVIETKTEPLSVVTPAPAEQTAEIAVAEPMARVNVHFTLGSSELSEEAVGVLTSAVDFLRSHPAVHVKLSGYTDTLGSVEANKALAMERVNSTARFFEHQGIDFSRVMTVAMGEADPALTPIGENSETWNRRVEIEFRMPPGS